MSKIGFVTCKKLPHLISGDQNVKKYLEKQNHVVCTVIWDDPTVNWPSFDLLVTRSTWDYYKHIDAFTSWYNKLNDLNVHIFNPPDIFNENKDKIYLHNLQSKGVTIVPTKIVKQSQGLNLKQILEENSWKEAIIKPSVSASSYKTWKITTETVDNGEEKALSILKNHTLLVQEYMPEIKQEGEWSLIFFNGKYSHSAIKKPHTSDFKVQEEYGGTTTLTTPSDTLLRQAQKIVNLYKNKLLYARVDGVLRDETLYLMELELIEPDLYLDNNPQGVINFATAIMQRLNDE